MIMSEINVIGRKKNLIVSFRSIDRQSPKRKERKKEDDKFDKIFELMGKRKQKAYEDKAFQALIDDGTPKELVRKFAIKAKIKVILQEEGIL